MSHSVLRPRGGPIRDAPAAGWGLLAGVFIFDATLTLTRRVLHGERWYEAHHSHTYQRAVQAGWSHARVSGTILLDNGVLGALAVVGWRRSSLLVPALLAGTALLTWLYLRFERLRPMWTRAEADPRRSAPPQSEQISVEPVQSTPDRRSRGGWSRTDSGRTSSSSAPPGGSPCPFLRHSIEEVMSIQVVPDTTPLAAPKIVPKPWGRRDLVRP
jgi:hypothetical protein